MRHGELFKPIYDQVVESNFTKLKKVIKYRAYVIYRAIILDLQFQGYRSANGLWVSLHGPIIQGLRHGPHIDGKLNRKGGFFDKYQL